MQLPLKPKNPNLRENIRMGIENMRNLGVWESVSLESVKECPRFCDLISIYRGWKTLKNSSDD